MILINIVKTINYMDNFSNWHFWILASMLLFILEIFTPGFVLACFGLGAIAAGIVSFFTSLEVQLLVFAFVCILSYIFIRPLAIKIINKDNGFKSNVDVLKGKKATVTKDFDSKLQRGRVKIDGDDWRAETEQAEQLLTGDVVEIVKVESNTLIVTKII